MIWWDWDKTCPGAFPSCHLLLCSIGRRGWTIWRTGYWISACRTRVTTGPANWVQQTWRARLKWWSRGIRPTIVKKQASCTTARGKKIPLDYDLPFCIVCFRKSWWSGIARLLVSCSFSFLPCSVGWTWHYRWINVLAKYYLDCIYMKSSFSFSAPISVSLGNLSSEKFLEFSLLE